MICGKIPPPPPQCLCRIFLYPATSNCCNNRCISFGMGSTPRYLNCYILVLTRSPYTLACWNSAVRNACLHFMPLIRVRCIKSMTENVACMFYVDQQRGVRAHSLYSKAITLWNWCILSHLHICSVPFWHSEHHSRLAKQKFCTGL